MPAHYEFSLIGLSSDEIDYMVAHDWGIIDPELGGNVSSLTSEEGAEDKIAIWEPYADAGIPIYIDVISAIHGAVSVTKGGRTITIDKTTPIKDYDYLYGDAIARFNEEGSYFQGYSWEQGLDNGIEWLRGAAPDKKLMQLWAANFYYPTNVIPTLWCDKDIEWRISQVDEIMAECYCPEQVPQVISIANYLRDYHPDIPFGVISYADDSIVPGATECWWNTWLRLPALPISTQLDLMQYWLTYIMNDNGAKFDLSGTMMSNPTYGGGQTTLQRLQFIESLRLTPKPAYHASNMLQTGTTPSYLGAGECNRPPTLTDTFTNTGNELILLKNYVDNCAVHEITVTSTDTLTHEDYTLTCLPERGTIIGPYPLDDYGALPTITYDNTNLYVSVLKVAPYADQV